MQTPTQNFIKKSLLLIQKNPNGAQFGLCDEKIMMGLAIQEKSCLAPKL